ncbi:MAG: CapA family protein [Sandaracinaceae bacterium]
MPEPLRQMFRSWQFRSWQLRSRPWWGRLAALLSFGLLVLAGVARSQDRSAPRHVAIGASGDILFHTALLETADAHGGYDHLFSALRSVIQDDEIAFANLETPLSVDREPTRGDPPRLGAPPEAATALAHAGFDVLSVANNHAWDQRDTGMVSTLENLRHAGIEPVGAAPDAADAPGPIVVTQGDVRVAFVAFTEIIQGHPGTRRPAVRIAMWDERAARTALTAAREQADVVVASMHWGLGYRHDDRSEQRHMAEVLVRHGADVVIGHGPHVLQRVERVSSPRGEAVVIYSLGNLISNQGYHYRRGVRDRSVDVPLREPATRDGVWMRVGVELGEHVRVSEVSAIPLWTHNNYWESSRRDGPAPDIRVLPLYGVSDQGFADERRRAIGGVLGEQVQLLDGARR